MASKYVIFVFCIYLYLNLASYSNARVEKGILKTHTSKEEDIWRFLARFCFVSGGGFEFNMSYPEKYRTQSINLYYDEPDQWEKVYISNMDCEKRTTVPYINITAGQQIRLNLGFECREENNVIKCGGGRTFVTARQRWWYMAVSRCPSDQEDEDVEGLYLEYDLTMTNGDGLFFKHFSADEFYILQIDITFLVLTLLLFIIAINFSVTLIKQNLMHSTFKLFMASLIFHLLYLFFTCIAFGVYAQDGIDRAGLRTFGRLFHVLFDITFVFMLVLMGKGYTITRGRLRKLSWFKLFSALIVYCVCYLLLFIVEAQLNDPAIVLYVYESAPGIALCVLRILVYFWFVYACAFTLKHYPEKNRFYIPFLVCFTLWFISVPIFVMIAAYAMADWVRSTVVNSVELFITFCGQVFFLILTAPCSANTNFPYHVKANQIGLMTQAPHHNEGETVLKDSDDEESSDSRPAINLPPYRRETEPSQAAPASRVSNAAPNFLDLFVTSQTHSEIQPKKMSINSVSQQIDDGYSTESTP